LNETAYQRMYFRRCGRLATVGSLLFFLGCASNGPARMTADRFDYTAAVAESYKEQNLMNLVRLRYADWPVFLNIQLIVAGYNWEVGGTISGMLNSPFGRGNDSVGGSVVGKYVERPTITYAPLSGQDFFRNLMRPIRPVLLMSLIQAGWPADVLLMLSTDSIGDLHNSGMSQGRAIQGDSEFFFVVNVIRELQNLNAIGVKYDEESSEFASVLHFSFRERVLPAEVRSRLMELKEMLGLDPESNTFEVVYGISQENSKTLTVRTRSVMQIMLALTAAVEVSEEDLASGRVPRYDAESIPQDPSSDSADVDGQVWNSQEPIMRVHQGTTPPKYPFTKVKYRGQWYWIEDTDWASKRIFDYLLLILTITETTETETPQLVITTN